MPLFAFVSGLVMWPPRERPLRGEISSRARGLLVPYVAWFLVLYAIDWSPHPAGGFGSALLDALVGRGGLWFLYALFVCTAVVLCLARGPRSRFVLPASALVAVVFSTGWLFAVPDVLYLSWVFWIYPFVVLGYLVGPLRAKVLDRPWIVVAVGLAAFLPLSYLRYPVHVPSLQPINRFRATGGAASVVAGHVLPLLAALLPYACASAAVLALLGAYLGRGGWAIEAQAWLGRKSLGIYAMHGVFVWWFASHGLKNVIALTLVSLGLSALATAALERTPVVGRLLLGQQVGPILGPRWFPRLVDSGGIRPRERAGKPARRSKPEVWESQVDARRG
jgi:fucose 4-O-acetylase-like acetyltransferase